ncbi:MAG: isopentenyl-diphosphate delta-isomerase [Methanomicrobiales archaeon]|nr:isopentenyl-diphosphate delta-isomerase [Methanomicrobiales archaeon]
MAKDNSTSPRKLDHIRICLEEQVEAGNPGFADVHLVHCALPGMNLDRIDTSVRFLGYRLRSPLFIAAMTGGHPSTTGINRRLAAAAEHFGIGMGVGSQRAALENPDLEGSFTVVREEAPTAFLCANLGAVQLRDHGIEWADRAVEMIGAQALCVHLNFLQEAIQPEGDHDATGCLEAIRDLCSDFRVPVIAKETGAGISWPAVRRLGDPHGGEPLRGGRYRRPGDRHRRDPERDGYGKGGGPGGRSLRDGAPASRAGS